MSDRELNDAYGLITDLRAKIVGLEAEVAGRALMDAEGEAFLPEVVTQLQDELQEAVRLLHRVHGTLQLTMATTPESAQRDIVTNDWLDVGAFLVKYP